ncbi:MAG: hypothetical protein U9N84_14790 [Actinomycetota bacterium]|nr:hypothetical protein [Actinomycetota bacterium]
MLYAVTEIAVFMVGATIVGILLGRITKRSTPTIVSGADTAELTQAQAAVRELESERASLRGQLSDAKERVRQLAAEPTAEETNHAATEEFAEQQRSYEAALEEAEAQADRLRGTIAERDHRIAQLSSGEPIPESEQPSTPLGYSSSAGTIADMKIVFGEEEE